MNKDIKNTIIEIGKTILVFLTFFFLPAAFLILLSSIGIKDDLLMQVLAELFVVIILCVAYKDTLIKDFKSFKKENIKFMLKWWILGMIVMIASNAIINVFVFNGEIALNEEQNRELLLSVPVLGVLLAGILAPILEELTFRRGFRRITNNKALFVFISAFVFALLHVLTGFSESKDFLEFLYLIPYGSLGVSFAVIYAYTDNIFSSIITHSFHNTLTVLLLILANSLV